VDLVLIEGFKREGHPKLEVHRAANEKPWLYPEDRRILAVASDIPPPAGAPPRLVLDDTDGIAAALLRLAAGGDAMPRVTP
jgi:molybdopterin-guanine dinucleotide biosynthesis protein B